MDVTAYGADYSAAEFTPEELAEYPRELDFLFRYIGYPTNRKCISYYPGAYRAHVDAGRSVGLYHQVAYRDFEGGRAVGRAHAQVALADARSEAVGWDGESPIVACFDRYMVKKDYPTIPIDVVREYVAGFRSVLGDVSGFYGFYDTMRACVEEDWVPFRMQCGAREHQVPGIQAWQQNNYQPTLRGVGTDELELYVPLATVFGRKDTEMQLTDRIKNAWGGNPTMEEVFRYIDLRSAEAAEGTAAANVKLDALLGREAGDVDEAELARQLLAQGLAGQLRGLSPEDIVTLKKAVGDEIEHRERVRLNVDLGAAEAEQHGQ